MQMESTPWIDAGYIANVIASLQKIYIDLSTDGSERELLNPDTKNINGVM